MGIKVIFQNYGYFILNVGKPYVLYQYVFIYVHEYTYITGYL